MPRRVARRTAVDPARRFGSVDGHGPPAAISLTEDRVRQWVGETLAQFKVPAFVEVREDKLPRNASGKLLKNVLRGTGDVSFDETM